MNEYQIAGHFGIALIIVWVAVYILSWIGIGWWNYVDDGEKEVERNPIIEFLAVKVFKYEITDKDFVARNEDGYNCSWKYRISESSGSNGAWPFFCVILVLGLLPVTLLVLFNLYILVLIIGLFVLITYLARNTRRNSKVFNKHVEDKDAHNG